MKTIVAYFDSYNEASRAVSKLESIGIAHGDISLVASNGNDSHSSHATRDFASDSHTRDTHADDGGGAGASIGTLAGGGAGLLAGLGMLAIPGLGPVVAAGWLVSTLVGAGAGAAVGGIVGALAGAGVEEKDAHAYAEGVRRGGAIVTVRADEGVAARVSDILDDEGRVDINERQSTWRAEGWTGSTPALGAAAGTAEGIRTGVFPESAETRAAATRTEVEIEDERARRMTGTDRDLL
jgi:hypothetical protein